jgi:hypothetical protein
MPLQTYLLSECLRHAKQTGEHFFGSANLGFEVVELSEGRSAGVQMVTLLSGDQSATVLPTRGLGIWRADCSGVRFGWNSPVDGPVHPNWVNLGVPSGLGWLDGFDELLVRCGLVSNGAPEFSVDGSLKWPLHGRIANLPAKDVRIEVDDQARTVAAQGTVIESRFLFYNWALHSRIEVVEDSPEIRIIDRVENRSDRPDSFQLLYHCNFGPPLLEAGSQLFVSTEEPVPRDPRAAEGLAEWRNYSGPDAQFSEQVYFLRLAQDHRGESLAMLANRKQNLGVYLRYDAANLPCFTLWKNTAGMSDGYVTGLEPGTNFPNRRSDEELAGRVVSALPGELVTFQCTIGMLVGDEAVRRTIQRIHSSN